VNPWDLDWGNIQPDRTNTEKLITVHIVNHDLQNRANFERTLRFLHARFQWFQRHLPPEWTQYVYIDDRGQRISNETRDEIRAGLTDFALVRFLSEGQ
jgi:hypothetical protein